MAGHGSPPAEDRGSHPGRQVGRQTYDPAAYTASGMHPEMAAEIGHDYEHQAMAELMSTPPQQGGGEGYYTYRKDRPAPKNYLD